MIRSFKILCILCGSAFLWSACTDVIDIHLQPTESQLVVDAWLDTRPVAQTIRLTRSQSYFDNTFAPGVASAEISVDNDLGQTFVFIDQGDGNYVWTPDSLETLGEVGTQFSLHIFWEGKHYSSHSEVKRVPQIDSIQIEVRKDELGYADGHYAAMFARDFPGIGDTYWIKAYKNGQYLNKPQELNIAYDAAFDAGGEIDGIIFIPPIRELINRYPDPDTGDDFDVPPYAPGDTVHVEIHSITGDAFLFLQTARDQMTNGDNTIFAIPIANTKGNVVDDIDGSPVLGFFCVSAVSEATKVVE